MPRETIRILCLEDNPGDARLILEMLHEATALGWDLPQFELIHAYTLAAALARLEEDRIDAMLTDLDLPDSQAGDTFARLRAHAPGLPVVVLTGREDEDLARRTVRAGADDYLFKRELSGSLLAHALLYAIERQRTRAALQAAHDALERRVQERTVELEQANIQLQQAAQALRESQQLLTRTFASLRDAVFVVDAVTIRILDCNPAASEIFGYSREELIGRTTAFLHVDEAALHEFRAHLHPAVATEGFLVLPEFKMKRKDGTVFPTEHIVTPLEDERGQHIGWVSVVRDVTARVRAEERINHLNRVLRAIRNVNQLIVQEKDPRRLIQRACDSLVETRGYYNAWIALVSQAGELQAAAGTSREFPALRERLADGETVHCIRLALTQENVQVITDPVAICADCPLAGGYAGRMGLAVRLQHGPTVYGLLVVSVSPEFGRDEEEHALLHEVAGDIALALHDIEREQRRQRAEESLRETTQLLETILDHTHMLVACMDPQFNFIWVNRAYAQADDREPAFFPGRNHFDLYPHAENQAIFQRVVETGVPYFAYAKPFEYAEHPERGVSYWDWSLVPIHGPDGAVVRLVLTLANVTGQVQAERALRERIKELNCLYGLSALAEQADLSLPEILQGAAALLPPAWQYPEIAGARILLGDQEFRTANFQETPWVQSQEIVVYGQAVGRVEVSYQEARPNCDEGPFLKEERDLLNAIAGRLGHSVERIQAAEELRRATENWERTFDAVPDLIAIIDQHYRIVRVNRAMAARLRQTPAACPGLHCYEAIHGLSAPPAFCPHAQLLQDGQEHVAEVREERLGGDFIVTTSPIYDAAGRLTGSVHIAHDITERKQAEDALAFLVQCGLAPGEDFFQSLARYLAKTLGMDYVCIDRLTGDQLTAQTEAVYFDGHFEDNVSYTLKDTPCGVAAGKTVCSFPSGVRHLFPQDQMLQDMEAESYVGATLWSYTGQPIGLIAAVGRRPLANPRLAESLLKLVVGRAAGELERRQAEEALQAALEDARRRQADTVALLAAAQAVLEYRRFADAAQAIFTVCKEAIGATAGYVALLSADGTQNELLFLDTGGLSCTVDPSRPMPIRGLRAEVYRTGQPIYDNDFAHSAWTVYLPAGHAVLDNVLFVPLLLAGRAVGLLGLANKPGGFTARDAQLAAAFGQLAAVALANSQAVEALERSEAQARRYAADLERSNQDLEHFAYAVSHDLSEPLRMVSSYLKLLEQRYRDQLDDRAREYIEHAVDGAARMQAMIKGVLDLSRVTTRGGALAPTDCEALLVRVLRALQFTIEETGAVITHDPLPTVRADEAQLALVFQNLLANALKFHKPGEPPRVHVSAHPSLPPGPLPAPVEGGERERGRGGVWCFSIQDHGIGLDPAQAGRIFQLFQRLHTQDEYPGVGIGLALCKRIVERHGGRIWVESAPGQGATFYFTLQGEPGERDAYPRAVSRG